MKSEWKNRCAASGEVDLLAYASRDGEWRAIGLAAPARRALVDVGLIELRHLTQWTRADLALLHGMGPHALKKIDEALMAKGLSFLQ
jgi:hypothetical protein